MTRRGWLLFAAMCVIWGFPYLLIRVAVREISPELLVFLRTSIAAVVLVPIAVASGEVRPVFARWRPLLVFTAIELAVPWFLLSSAETRVSSSLTGLLIAGVPLVGAVVVRASGERGHLGPWGVAGLVSGMVGVGAIVGLDLGGASAIGLGEIAVVAVCYAVGPIILSRFLAGLPALGVIAVSLAIGAVVYAPVAAFGLPDRVPAGRVIVSIVVLAVVCTAVAFVVFFALIAEIGPVRATVITYVNPAVAVLLGVTILSEGFTIGMGFGFVLVLTGSLLATRSRPPGKASRRIDTEPVPAAPD